MTSAERLTAAPPLDDRRQRQIALAIAVLAVAVRLWMSQATHSTGSPVECVAWDIQRRTATARTAMASAIWRWRRSSSGGAAVNLSAEVMAANQKEEERAVFLLRMIRGLSQGDAGFGFT